MATEKVVVQGSDVPVSQLSDLYRQIADRSLNGLEIRALLGVKRPATVTTTWSTHDMLSLAKQIELGKVNKRAIQECLEHRYPFGLDKIEIDWNEVYSLVGIETWRFEKYFPTASGNIWEVIVLPGVNMSNLVGAIQGLGVDLEQEYDYESAAYADGRHRRKHDRDPYFNGAYRVSFPRALSSDVDLTRMSHESYVELGLQGITVYEKLLLELGFILATGRVMEKKTLCVCAGSDSGNDTNPIIGHNPSDVKAFYQEYGVSFLGRAWDAGYGSQNIRTHMIVPGSFKGLR